MALYNVEIYREFVEHIDYDIEAENEDDAIDLALDKAAFEDPENWSVPIECELGIDEVTRLDADQAA